MKKLLFFLGPLSAVLASSAHSANPREIKYEAVPSWVLPPPATLPDAAQTSAPFQIIYQESEERALADSIESFTAYRVKILKPEALAFGNVTITWSPSSGPVTVHFLRIIRDGKPIDILEHSKFTILERESGLDRSILDGNLTATLQVPDLRVGDELEFAATIARRESALGNHIFGATQLPVAGLPGTFRYRLLWSPYTRLTWSATKDMPTLKSTKTNDGEELLVMLKNPPMAFETTGAPPRENLRRAIEYTDFSTWADLSRQFWSLFEEASRLTPSSPLRAEAAKIAATSADSLQRAQAALRFVQDQIRYVYVGLDGANYRPASADETWSRRFGDCKAKTAVLLALLNQLGVEAEPALVNSKGGDGTNERLPNPGLFDHVVVRAKIASRTYWLDGTRLGDKYLDMLPPPPFRWALPLRSAGAELVSVPATTSLYPQIITVLDIDATAGPSRDAKIRAKDVYRGDDAFQIKSQLASLSPQDADRAVRTYWQQQADWVTPESVNWTFDERHSALQLTLTGTGKIEWDGDEKEGYSYVLPGGGFTPPNTMKRPAYQDQKAPWSVEYPRFRCWATTIHLPPATAHMRWGYSSNPVNRRLGGTIYWRAAGMTGNVVRTVMSKQNYVREISAAEAAQVNDPKPPFDNYKSWVEETSSAPKNGSSTILPFTDSVDWLANPAPCSPPQ